MEENKYKEAKIIYKDANDKAVLYGVILIAILEIKAFYVKLLRWWIYSGISWIAGVVFSVIDKIKEKENGEEI